MLPLQDRRFSHIRPRLAHIPHKRPIRCVRNVVRVVRVIHRVTHRIRRTRCATCHIIFHIHLLRPVIIARPHKGPARNISATGDTYS